MANTFQWLISASRPQMSISSTFYAQLFYTKVFGADLLSSDGLALLFFGTSISVQKLLVKCYEIDYWLVKLTLKAVVVVAVAVATIVFLFGFEVPAAHSSSEQAVTPCQKMCLENDR